MAAGLPRCFPSLPCLLLAACAADARPAAGPTSLQHYGVMREVMREGRTGPRAALADYESPGWYGVGALAGLGGEILIDDGRVLVARDDAAQITDAAGQAQATLLTVARVGSWRRIRLPSACDLDELEHVLAAEQPMASVFLVEGPFDVLDMHVVRGSCPHGEPDPAHEPFRWQPPVAANTLNVRIVGFHVPGQEGVMTHHGTAIHAHALVQGPFHRALGHVDRLVLRPGATLWLPAD